MNGYDTLKQLSASTSISLKDLIVLSRSNDPFLCGQPSQVRRAEWFTEQWDRLGFTGMTGVHIRRMHYKLVSGTPVAMLNGRPYQNTDECWLELCEASKFARILRMVPADAFIDRRNPPAVIHAPISDPAAGVSWYVGSLAWSLPELRYSAPFIGEPTAFADGYEYQDSDQPYHLELWIEKSTMSDVLLPVARRFRADVVTGLGFLSITAVIRMLERAAAQDKPVRIFYISDFDPAGDMMPTAIARQIEYWADSNIDIKLTPLILTREQVAEYNLPRIPIKESDKRRAGFEDRRGDGAVELDALEALHPGVFAQLLEEALAPYWDCSLRGRLACQSRDVNDEIAELWAEYCAEELAALEDIKSDAMSVHNRFSGDIERLQAEIQAEMEPISERLRAVEAALAERQAEFDVDLPDREEAQPSGTDENEWLFDHARDYLEQIEMYRQYRNAP